MANTYAKVYLHYVTAVKYRDGLITENYRLECEKFISELMVKRGHNVESIYCRPDHLHLFCRWKVTDPIPVGINQMKTKSSIEFSRTVNQVFKWQSGGSVFSVSRWDVDQTNRYINNQDEHHKDQTFLDEYEKLLAKHGIEYDPKYILKDPIWSKDDPEL